MFAWLPTSHRFALPGRLALAMGWRRLGALPLLLLLVLLLHLWLITGLWPAPVKRLGQDSASDRPAPPRALQLVPMPQTMPVLPVLPDAAPAVPAAPDMPRPRAALAPPAPLPPTAEPAPEPDMVSIQAQAPAQLADESAEPADAQPPAPGQPPPVYPTRVPPPVSLSYTMRMNELSGQARLVWRHQDGRYQLSLHAWGAAGPLLEQHSEGGFDAAGLAPERFIDRRRGRGWRSANFQRERGLISFSGPRLSYPAWPGAQDRLSWMAQLAAISAAMPVASAQQPMPGQAAPAVAMFVVDARGLGDVWQLQAGAEQALDTVLGQVKTSLWQREPPRPEGLRVQAWLDPARGHWPVRLRLTALRSGAVFELELAEPPGQPP